MQLDYVQLGKLNTSKWAKITEVSHDTALRDIQSLLEQGILVKEDGAEEARAIGWQNCKQQRLIIVIPATAITKSK